MPALALTTNDAKRERFLVEEIAKRLVVLNTRLEFVALNPMGVGKVTEEEDDALVKEENGGALINCMDTGF